MRLINVFDNKYNLELKTAEPPQNMCLNNTICSLCSASSILPIHSSSCISYLILSLYLYLRQKYRVGFPVIGVATQLPMTGICCSPVRAAQGILISAMLVTRVFCSRIIQQYRYDIEIYSANIAANSCDRARKLNTPLTQNSQESVNSYIFFAVPRLGSLYPSVRQLARTLTHTYRDS